MAKSQRTYIYFAIMTSVNSSALEFVFSLHPHKIEITGGSVYTCFADTQKQESKERKKKRGREKERQRVRKRREQRVRNHHYGTGQRACNPLLLARVQNQNESD